VGNHGVGLQSVVPDGRVSLLADATGHTTQPLTGLYFRTVWS
jgi:hypothetical protein